MGDPRKNRLPARIRGWAGTATGGHIHVVHISHTHPPKEIIQALRKYLLGKNQFFIDDFINQSTRYVYVRIGKRMFENSFLPSSSHPQNVVGRRITFVTIAAESHCILAFSFFYSWNISCGVLMSKSPCMLEHSNLDFPVSKSKLIE